MKIGILGCGWLGLPLGAHLAEQGFEVKGTTTQPEKLAQLASNGIQPFLLALRPTPQGDPIDLFLEVDLLIITIPPQTGKQGEAFHPQQIERLLPALRRSKVRCVLYISSTSVYPDLNREVIESDVTSPAMGAHQALLQAEDVLTQLSPAIQVTILRCGGLMGYNRMAGKYVAGQKGLTTGNQPVNFIHRDDVIGIIEMVIREKKWGEVFNVVAPMHPSRKEVYRKNAEEFGLEQPEFVESPESPYKIVSSQKLIDSLNYAFKFSNPLDFTYQF